MRQPNRTQTQQARRVQASVNYATEKAKVIAPVELDPEVLIGTVEDAGYGATLPAPVSSGSDSGDPADRELESLRHRLIGAVVLTVPVIAMAMVPAWQFTNWQWASLTLAAPVVVWGAWPFHRAAAINLRHGAPPWTPHLAGHAGRVRLVIVRAVLRRCRRTGDDARFRVRCSRPTALPTSIWRPPPG